MIRHPEHSHSRMRHEAMLLEAERIRLVKSLNVDRPTSDHLFTNRRVLYRVGICLIVLLLAIANVSVASAAPLTTTNTTVAPAQTTLNADWQSYHDPVSQLTFEHPHGWVTDEPVLAVKTMSNRYQVRLSSNTASSNIGSGAQVELDVIKSTAGTLTEIVAQQKLKRIRRDPNLVIVEQARWTLAWRQPAIYLQLEGADGASAVLITRSGGKTIVLSGTGDLEHFQMIAQTLRIKPTVGPT